MQVRFTQAQLTDFLKRSMDKFFAREVEYILSGVAERSLCGRLAIYMESLLEQYNMQGYFADPECNRKQDGEIKTMLDEKERVVKIQCDLIVHSRGNEEPDNLIAVEMKKSDHPESAKQSDKTRLRVLTKQQGVFSTDGTARPEHVAGYRLGIYIELDIKQRTCLYEKYKGGDMIGSWTDRF